MTFPPRVRKWNVSFEEDVNACQSAGHSASTSGSEYGDGPREIAEYGAFRISDSLVKGKKTNATVRFRYDCR